MRFKSLCPFPLCYFISRFNTNILQKFISCYQRKTCNNNAEINDLYLLLHAIMRLHRVFFLTSQIRENISSCECNKVVTDILGKTVFSADLKNIIQN